MDSSIISQKLAINWFDLAQSGVFIVKDEQLRECFVSCSNNMLKGISYLVTQVRDKDHVCGHFGCLEIEVMYLGPETRLVGSQVIEKLQIEGYKVLNKVVPVSYSPRIRILDIENETLAVVTLRSRRGNEIVIAGFKDMGDAELWLEENYPGGLVTKIVKSNTEVSRKVRLYLEGL